MEKFRDYLYNKSDIMITLVIILIALALITWRVNVIIHYGTSAQTTVSESSSADSGNGSIVSSSSQSDGASTSDNGTVYTVTIPLNSTASSMAQILLSDGLISDKQSFLDAVSSAGAETKMKAGTFKIPSGSTPEEIVQIFIK